MKKKNNTDLRLALSKRIRQIRKEKGLRLIDVAALAGISYISLIRIEHAHFAFTVDTLDKVAEALNFKIEIIEKEDTR
ncbi:MAG: helix-turn-helix domain-containing protein [Bacteroidales bacterium]